MINKKVLDKAGYGVISGPDTHIEYDTQTCFHCNRVYVVRSNEPGFNINDNRGGWCLLCSGPICDNCVGKECSPFLKKLEEYEAKSRSYEGVVLD